MDNKNNDDYQKLNYQPQIANPMTGQPQPPKVPSIFTASIVFSAISLAAWCIVGIFTIQLMLACQTGGCSGLFLLFPIMIAICTEFPAFILLVAAGVQLFRYKTSPVFPTARKQFLTSLIVFLFPVVLTSVFLLLTILLGAITH